MTAVAVTVIRLWVSHGRDEYSIWPDEPAQLAIARSVGGGTRWYMHDHSIWRPLYGTLLAPVHWFTDDPTTVFHTALVVNALLGGAAAWLLVLLARRLTSMPPGWCAVAALLVALSPAVLFTTNFVYSESLLVALYLAALLFLVRVHDTASVRDGVLAGLCAAAAFGTHSRMLPLALIVIGCVVLAAARHRMSWFDALVVTAVTVAGVVAVVVGTDLLVDRLWNEPSTRNSPEGVLDQATKGTAVLVSLVGQTWTMLVASVGVVAYGTVVLARAALGRGGDGRTSRAPIAGDARVVLVVVGACVALSVVFMSDRWRSDQLVYGRYNAAVVGPVLIVGFAALIGSVPVARLGRVVVGSAAVTAVCGVLLWNLRRELLQETNGLEPMILGLQPFITSPSRIDVPRITAWAIAVACAVGAVAIGVRTQRRRAIAVAVLLTVLVGWGSVRTGSRLDQTWNPSRSTRAVATLRTDVLTDHVPVDYFLPTGSDATVAMMLYQFHLPETPFAVVSDPLAGPAGSLVFAPDDDPVLRERGADIVWRDPHRPIALWRR